MGGYRDEDEALRSKVEALEADLADARRALARYEGEAPETPEDNLFLGAPARLVHERRLDGELSESGLEAIVSELRREIGELGRIDRLGRTLAWSTGSPQGGRRVEVTVEARDGETWIRLTEHLGPIAGGLFGGIVGGVGGGGLGAVLPLLIGAGYAALSPLVAALWILAVYAVVRNRFARMARKRNAQLERLGRRSEVVAERDIQRVRARVELEDESNEEGEEPVAEEAVRARTKKTSGA